jgi:hypothetical protein
MGRVLYKKFGNKCLKILKFWRTELSYAQNKNRGEKMRLLGMDTCRSLNDIMEIRCNERKRNYESQGGIYETAKGFRKSFPPSPLIWKNVAKS